MSEFFNFYVNKYYTENTKRSQLNLRRPVVRLQQAAGRRGLLPGLALVAVVAPEGDGAAGLDHVGAHVVPARAAAALGVAPKVLPVVVVIS